MLEQISEVNDLCIFQGCSGLSIVKLPNNSNNVCLELFYSCSKLKYVAVPDSVTSIAPYAFSGCSSLETIIIPSGVKNLYEYCFSNCSLLTSISYKGTIEDWNKITKDNSWDSNTGNYTVYCTDGEITKS